MNAPRCLLALALLGLAAPAGARPSDDDEWDEPRPKETRRGERAPQIERVERVDAEAPRRLALTGPRGTINTQAIQGAIRPHLPEVRFCFDRERQKRPDLAGRVHVRFVVAPTGQVSDAELDSSTVESAAVENCLIAAVRRWSFPRPTGGSALVVYPFSAMAR